MVIINSLITLLAADLSIPQGAGTSVSFKDPTGFANIGTIITDLVPYIFVLSGLVLLFFLINGGFDLLTSAGDPKKVEAGKEKITAAVIGFLIVFASFWIYQIVLYILGVQQ